MLLLSDEINKNSVSKCELQLPKSKHELLLKGKINIMKCNDNLMLFE